MFFHGSYYIRPFYPELDRDYDAEDHVFPWTKIILLLGVSLKVMKSWLKKHNATGVECYQIHWLGGSFCRVFGSPLGMYPGELLPFSYLWRQQAMAQPQW